MVTILATIFYITSFFLYLIYSYAGYKDSGSNPENHYNFVVVQPLVFNKLTTITTIL